MRTLVFILSGIMSFCASAAVKESKWCKVELPDSVPGGSDFQIRVTPVRDLPQGCNLSIHMHYMRSDGRWGGMYEWRPAQNAKKGKTSVFSFKARNDGKARTLSPIMFVAPGGDFGKKIADFDMPLGNIALGGSGKAAKGGAKSAKNAEKAVASAYPEKPAGVTYKKSYIWLEEAPQPTRAGEDLTLKIHYYLDPADTWGDKPTQLHCMPLGPWIDNPDGVVNKSRRHVGYPGLYAQTKTVETGDHVIEFKWKLQKTFRYNGCFFLCRFKSPDGADWPWDWRGGGMKVIKESPTFYVEPTALGGLFKYSETPEIKIGWGERVAAGGRTAKVTVKNVAGKVVCERTVKVDPSKKEETFKLDSLPERGTFLVKVAVPDVGEDYCYFGTIPQFVREKGRRTPFGVTNIYDEEFAKIAGELGFSFTRLFQGWNALQPAPKVWMLENLDRTIKINNDAGLKPWICLYSPPAWALPEGMWSAGFEPSPFDLKAWSAILDKLARRYDGSLWGFEWLNEIVPGNKCKDPVKEYVDICRTGYRTVKAVNPKLVCQLAGGLWPHNYRVDLLNSGVGEWVDVLPVHYSTYEGVLEAKSDLSVRGISRVRVADNETASGLSTWNMEPEAVLAKSIAQCRHVMTRWPDELCAGSVFITYFGGSGDPCGNWSYMIDRTTPRPCAVTLGVVQGKIGYARAVGKFFIGDMPVQLFEKDGKAIAFVCAPGKEGVRLALPAAGELTVTDYQGNVSKVRGAVIAGDMPVIVEGLDLDAMKLHSAFRIGTSELPAPEPQVVLDASDSMAVPVFVRNPYRHERTFTLTPSPASWGGAERMTVKLAAGESKSVELFYTPNPGAKIPATTKLSVAISSKGVPSVAKPFILYAIDPDSIGNLVKNGDFEKGSESWGGNNPIVDAPGGTGKAMLLAGSGRGKWKSSWQSVDIPVPGQQYLYTCWMRGDNQGGGSNIGEHFSDGSKSRNYYMPAVFSMGEKGSGGWRLMVKRFASHPNTGSLTLTPVCAGTGRTYYDNFSLSLYRGTDYAAFAGRVGGEKRSSKVPLLCDNQVQQTGGYSWSPQNLAGVAEFSWDAQGLKLRCEVTDDVSAPKAIVSATSADGAEALKGDMLALAVFPKIGADGMPESKQLRWYMNLASPGGGSGATTLFRPVRYSMGLKAGQLAKDSSVYQVDFSRRDGKTVYDVKIPWAEIPGFSPQKGASFGCSLVLIDSDRGAGAGRMIWGADLSDTASGCGVVTLLP